MIVVQGAARMAATLLVAADQVADLDDGHQAAAAIIAAAGAAAAPRRTGALAGGHQATAGAGWAQVTNTVRYAPYVHNGTSVMRARPWLQDASVASQPLWLSAYVDDLQDALDAVEGT